jgi:hypothetical protein
MEIPNYETRLDVLFNQTFNINDLTMLDWAALKFELKFLRKKFNAQQAQKECGCNEKEGESCLFCNVKPITKEKN